jgi:hypothetical protein
MTKANSWRGHNTSLPPSPLSSSCYLAHPEQRPERRRTFCVEGRKFRIPKKIHPAHRPKSPRSIGRFRSDQFQIATLIDETPPPASVPGGHSAISADPNISKKL